MWFFPLAIACGNTVILKPSEKDPSAANCWPTWLTEAGLPDGVFNVVHGDKEAVDRCSSTPTCAAISFVGSTPIARYVYETGTRARQAGAGARRGEEPHGRAARRRPRPGRRRRGQRRLRLGGRALHGDLRRWSRSSPIGDELVREDRRADGTLGPATAARLRHGAAGHRRAPRQGRRPMWTPASTQGAELVVDGRDVEIDGDGGGFWLGPTLFDHVTPEMTIYTDEIFGPVLSVVRVGDLRRRARAGQRATRTATAPRSSPTTVARRGGSSTRWRSAWSASTCRSRCRWRTTRSAAGRRRCSATRHAYGAEGVHFFTRGKVVTSRWLDPSHGGVNLGFPQNV